MRLLLALCVAASFVMCSCKGSRQQPKEASKEAFLAIMDASYKAIYDGDWETVAQLRHPRAIQEMQALYRFNGEQWPPPKPAVGDRVRGVADTFPDPANVRLEIAGDWARLVHEGPDLNSLALFSRADGKWVWVASVTDHGHRKFDADGICLDNPLFGISRLHVWPMEEDRLWLPPVELIAKRVKDGPDGLPRFEFHVKNVGVKPLTQWQLRAFFSSVFYRVDASDARRANSISCEFPTVLSPGQQLMLTDDIDLSLGKPVAPGRYAIRWYASGYLSNEVEVEVK